MGLTNFADLEKGIKRQLLNWIGALVDEHNGVLTVKDRIDDYGKRLAEENDEHQCLAVVAFGDIDFPIMKLAREKKGIRVWRKDIFWGDEWDYPLKEFDNEVLWQLCHELNTNVIVGFEPDNLEDD